MFDSKEDLAACCKSAMAMAEVKLPHCLMCGNCHEVGQCPPENFAYLECGECNKIITMPWDALHVANSSRGVMGCGGCGSENSFELINDPTSEQVSIANK